MANERERERGGEEKWRCTCIYLLRVSEVDPSMAEQNNSTFYINAKILKGIE